MKRPYYNEAERFMMRMDTVMGAQLLVKLAWKKLKREIYRLIKSYLK